MSLINQVLRDLDARHAATEQKDLPNEVRPLPAVQSRQWGMPVGMAVLALAAAGVWAAWDPAPSTVKPASGPLPIVELPPPPLVIAPPATPEPLAAAQATTPIAATPVSAPASLRLSSMLSQRPEPSQAAPVIATTSTAPVPSSVDKQIRIDSHQRAETAYRKAVTERQQGRDADAITLLREALQQEPTHGNARQLLLSLLVERKQWPEAEAILKEGLDLSPAHGPWAMALARIQVERGQTAQAWDTLARHMQAGEGSAEYLGFAGVVLQRLQRPAEAAGYFESALRLKPEARWWIGLGIALENTDRAGDAREAFQRAATASGLTTEMSALIQRRLAP